MMPFKPTRQWTINCRDCKQRISKLVSNGRVINDIDGVGGQRGQDHICPNRFKTGASGDQQRMKKTMMCHRCLRKFSGRHVDCPFCFRLICQNCGSMQYWLLDTPKNTCVRCGHKYLDWTEVTKFVPFDSYHSRFEPIDELDPDQPVRHLKVYGTYVKKTPEEINWHQVIAVNVPKQIFDCARYGHVLRQDDKFCRVCGVGVIRP